MTEEEFQKRVDACRTKMIPRDDVTKKEIGYALHFKKSLGVDNATAIRYAKALFKELEVKENDQPR